MIQSFHLTHDDMTPFLTILRAIIETTFSETPSKYAQLYLTTDMNYMFRDGKKWIGDDPKLLKKLGVKSLGASDERGWSKPKLLYVCSVSDYKSDMKDQNGIPYNNYNYLMERICVLLQEDPNQKQEKFTQLKQKCGSGYNYAFNSMDGDIGLGYSAQHRPNGAWHNIDIAFCHIYYGK